MLNAESLGVPPNKHRERANLPQTTIDRLIGDYALAARHASSGDPRDWTQRLFYRRGENFCKGE